MARREKSASPAPAPARSFEARLAYGLVLLIAVVVPWLFSYSVHESFRLPKLVAAEALTLGSILCLAIAWARGRLPTPPRPTLEMVIAVLAPMVTVAALGLVTSNHPAHLRQTLAAFAIGAAGCAAWALGFDRERLERLLVWSVLPGVGLAAAGILQSHDLYQPFSFAKGFVLDSRLTVISLAGNAGEFGGYLLLPALIAQWRMRGEPRRRWLWGAALAILVYGQIVSQTLTALAALIAGSALFWLLAVPARRRGLVVAGTLAAALLVSLGAPPVRDRIAAISDRLTVGRLNAALSGRLDGWRVAAHLFTEHPLDGVGLGGFAPEFAPARLALQAQGVPFFLGHRESFFSNAHNEFLEWAAECGVLGLAALGYALWTLGRRVQRLGDDHHQRAFALAALAALTLLASAYFPLRLPLLAYPILLLAAWLMRATTTTAEEAP